MKAIILNKPGDFSIKEIETPEIKEDEVLIQIKTSGIISAISLSTKLFVNFI